MLRFSTLLLLAALGASARLSASPLVPTSYTINAGTWAYWDDTGKQLTDGLYNAVIPGANLGVPDAYNWVGWSGNNPSVTFDFGQVVTINSLSLSTVSWGGAGVYLPTKVAINSSVFTVSGVFPAMDKAVLTFGGTWTGSTLNLELTTAGSWTFLDEVTFEQRVVQPVGNNVPEGGATAAYVAMMFGLLACAKSYRRVSALR